MDFQSLSRRELQALCKNNKIPANITNVAMAELLLLFLICKFMRQVEGLEELGKDLYETPLRQTASRTTNRRKPAMEQEPVSIQSTRTRCGKSNAVSEKTDEEENININSLQTPIATTTQRRAPSALARTKLATEKVDKKKAPAAATGQSVYSTRRSTRLLEKTMAELTLTDKKIEKPNTIDDEPPEEVNMTEKETCKPIKMEELNDVEDMSKGVSNEGEENNDIEDVKSSVIPKTESKRELVDVPDLEEATKEETLDNDAEENKDDTGAPNGMPETESTREVVDVPDVEEATKEETLDIGAEQSDDTGATNVGDVVGDGSIITCVEDVKRVLESGEELLVEADDKLVIEMKNEEIVESEEGEKSFPDAEEAADLEVMDDDQTVVAPEWNDVVAAENADEATSVSSQKMKEKESVCKEELLLQVYADPESVAANNTNPSSVSATLKSSKQSDLVDSCRKGVVELPLTIAGNANAAEVVIQKKNKNKKSLEEKSLRQLTRMMKEILVINYKEEAPANLVPKKQQQVEEEKVMIRNALQKFPDNLQVGEAGSK